MTPETTGDDIGQRYFNVSLSERRLVVRCMIRYGLATSLPADACSLVLPGGVFAVAKDSTRDRLICDRKPQNSQESSTSGAVLRGLAASRRPETAVHSA